MTSERDVTIDITGLPEVKAMLAQFTPSKFRNRVRRGMRAAAKPLREELRRKAGTRSGPGHVPLRFKKTVTKNHQNPDGVSVTPSNSLWVIFEHGAKPHMIGAFHHPGMAARPFVDPVFDAKKAEAEKAFMDALLGP